MYGLSAATRCSERVVTFARDNRVRMCERSGSPNYGHCETNASNRLLIGATVRVGRNLHRSASSSGMSRARLRAQTISAANVSQPLFRG